MSKLETNTIAPSTGTTLTLGESGDTTVNVGGTAGTGFGKILNVYQVRTSTVDVTSTSYVDIGLSQAVTPVSSSSNFLLMQKFTTQHLVEQKDLIL